MNMLGRIKIGTLLCPKNGTLTGWATVLDCIPLPPEMLVRKDMYDYDCLYTVLTDFGNTFRMSPHELLATYELGCVEDIKDRCEKIIKNHQSVLESLL